MLVLIVTATQLEEEEGCTDDVTVRTQIQSEAFLFLSWGDSFIPLDINSLGWNQLLLCLNFVDSSLN